MEILLYVPEELDPTDYLVEAAKNKINQIIHGSSDILLNLVDDLNKVQKIEVPQFYGAWIENSVSPSDKDITLVFIDEWSKERNYSCISAKIYEIDLNNPRKSAFLERVEFSYDNKYTYHHKFKFKNIGEYKIDLIAELDDGTEYIIESKDIIIFRNKNE